jgi:hypothetical protein
MHTQSRQLRKGWPRHFKADSANFILEKLSSAPANPAKERIRKLLDLLREAERCEKVLSDHLYARMKKLNWDGHIHELQEEERSPAQDAYSAAIDSVNRVVRRYRSVPTLQPAFFDLDELTGLRFSWEAERVGTWHGWENGAFRLILDLIATKEFHRLHRCRNCSKWFYSITDHQLHCSDNCRKQFASRDPKFKERRRRYMATRRRGERELGQRWLAAVRSSPKRRSR